MESEYNIVAPTSSVDADWTASPAALPAALADILIKYYLNVNDKNLNDKVAAIQNRHHTVRYGNLTKLW